MWPTHEASLPRFRSKTYYEWFPMSVLQFLHPFLDCQVLDRGTWKAPFWSCTYFLGCGNGSQFYMHRWTECGWMQAVTLYHDSIHFPRTHLICANWSTEWSRLSEFDRQQSGRRGQLRLRCRQCIVDSCDFNGAECRPVQQEVDERHI